MSDLTYTVYRDGEIIKTGIKAKSFTDTDLDSNVEYSYQVSATNSAGESELSEAIVVITDTLVLDFSDLENLIANAKDYNSDDYTEESYEALQLAITEAEEAMNSIELQSDLDEAIMALQDAIDNLEEPEPEITVETETENIDIVEYDTVRNDTESLPLGEEETVQEGKDGYTKVTYKVTYEDGVETSREETDREVIEPVDEIINVGTYEEPEITVETETENIDIVEYGTVRNDTDELPKGEEQIVQEGVNGYTKVTYEVTYEDGEEVKREETDRETIDPIDEIINVGTFEEPEPEPED